MMHYDRKSFFHNISHYLFPKDRALDLYPTFPSLITTGCSQKYRDVTMGSEIWEWEKHEEPFDGSLQGSSNSDVELGIL